MQKKLILITGPSGVGKTTLAHMLLKNNPNIERLVTYTTRQPRPNEKNGIDYNFVDNATFQEKLASNDFFEHAEVYGYSYGNSRQKLQEIWDQGKLALMVLDIQGVTTIESQFPEALSIFIKPDTLENLRARILKRPMSDEDFAKRWEKVTREMALAGNCDQTITNRENAQSEALLEIKNLINIAKLD